MSAAVAGAMDTWAAARAGASFSPSPTIRTFRPSLPCAATRATFSAGRSSAEKSSDAELRRQALDHSLPVAGEDFHRQSLTHQVVHCLPRIGPDAILHDESRKQFTIPRQDGHGRGRAVDLELPP